MTLPKIIWAKRSEAIYLLLEDSRGALLSFSKSDLLFFSATMAQQDSWPFVVMVLLGIFIHQDYLVVQLFLVPKRPLELSASSILCWSVPTLS